ncbi:MAG: hypothetical protein ACRCY3_08110 [Sphingorhabdus sp.]
MRLGVVFFALLLATPSQAAPVERPALPDVNHPYLSIARYALSQAHRREAGQGVRSAVLIERVSLIEPRAVDCGNKPFAIAIDMDAAPGETIIEGEPEGFGELLEALRRNDIAIAWLSDRRSDELVADLHRLGAGDVPAFKPGDIELFAYPGLRKQDHRWNLAASHCVVAIAGDQRTDFDELFAYLRDADYAIRLDAWIDRGWFLLPHPVSVADAPSPPAEIESKP